MPIEIRLPLRMNLSGVVRRLGRRRREDHSVIRLLARVFDDQLALLTGGQRLLKAQRQSAAVVREFNRLALQLHASDLQSRGIQRQAAGSRAQRRERNRFDGVEAGLFEILELKLK